MPWLKRLLLPLEKRSITGLALELVVVVSGIFLGLQADQWNDRRIGYQLEADYLQRLYTELVVGLEAQSADIDAAIDKDIVLLWTDDVKKVITGADLLGRLLRGI